MKIYPTLLLVFILAFSCSPVVNAPVLISNTVVGNWVLTAMQSPGIGGAGIWSPANPSGKTMELTSDGKVSGTAFPGVNTYQAVDSVTLKLIDPNQPAGFLLFGYHVDTVAHSLFFYIKPTNGGICIEGCGGYRFER